MSKTAICIGINYVGTPYELNGCVNDANDWGNELANRGFHVDRLIDGAATRNAILTGLANAIQSAGPTGVCVVTYSGHGSFQADDSGDDGDGTDELWCPVDFGIGIYITDDEIYDVIRRNANGAQVIVISDSCYSGTITKASRFELMRGKTRARFMPPSALLPPEALARTSITPRRRGARPDLATLLSACAETEVCYDAYFEDRANGAFTYCALNALRSLSGTVTYRRWMDEIRKYLPSTSYGQTPGIQGTSEQRDRRVFDRAAGERTNASTQAGHRDNDQEIRISTDAIGDYEITIKFSHSGAREGNGASTHPVRGLPAPLPVQVLRAD